MHYTRGSVSSEAEAIVGNLSLGTITDSAINRVLNKLYTKWEWGFLTKQATVAFSVSIASVALPTDYVGHLHLKWRDTSASPAYEHNIAWIDYSKYILINTPLEVSNVPRIYTISPQVSHGASGSLGNILIWPTFQTSSNPNCQLSYYYLPTIIAKGAGGDSSVILFQNYNFLVEATVNELYRYLRDPRYQPRWIEATVDEIRQNMLDFGAVSVPTIGLDPKVFKSYRARFGQGSWGI